jgi:3-hydroxyacyl-CoA dehydrogenase / enoyl-CoA hydratase / 3-hydroxybutyryl-CoA epimerase
MSALTVSMRDQVAILTWNDSSQPMNVMSEPALLAFDAALQTALADPAVRGVVITSGRREFVVGADISMLTTMREQTPAAAFAAVQRLSFAFRAMETQTKPVIAALNGDALGGGLELAMACHGRLCANDPSIKLGLPEVMLGLLPGAGGTQRLPRLIGAQEALKVLTTGKPLRPDKALKLGLVDELVAPELLLDRACEWISSGQAPSAQRWDKPGYTPPQTRYMDELWMQTFGAGNALLRKEARGNYPAPQAIMACVYHGLQISMEAALKYEGRQFVALLHGRVSRAMTRTLWFGRNRANKLEKRPLGIAKTQFSKVGVLGAGVMGAGIAIVTAEAGIDCVLLDVSNEAAERGRQYCIDYWQRQLGKGRLDLKRRDALIARLRATADYADLAGAELVIEAVFEDRAIKARVTQATEAVTAPTSVFGSNTSTLPISGLAQGSTRPAQYIGIHFFSPVEKMPLVEIIRGQQTSDAATAVAMDYVQAIKKTPIVVNDARGFYTSRVFGTYAREAFEMLHEGIDPVLIENAGKLAGMPMGPFELTDMIGVDTAHKIGLATAQEVGWEALIAKGENPENLKLLEWLVVEQQRPGQKIGRGFYDYDSRKPTVLWAGLRERFPGRVDGVDVADLKRRFLHIQALETVRCLEENVVTAADDADVGSIFGWGFAPFTGGVMSYIDGIGVAQFLADCRAYTERLGARFRPPLKLIDMAAGGGRFYPVEPG